MCRHGSDSGGGAAGRPQTRASKRAADFHYSPAGATGDGARPLITDWYLASERNRHVSMRPLLHYSPTYTRTWGTHTFSKIAVPTAADWHAFSPGDCIMLAPSTSKSDQFGEEHCPFPSILPYDGDDSSAAASIRDIELESPCPPHMRRKTPLFADEQGHPFSYSMLHGDLRSLLDALFGRAFSLAFSWHSVRIGLACALHAADCPDAVIQLI